MLHILAYRMGTVESEAARGDESCRCPANMPGSGQLEHVLIAWCCCSSVVERVLGKDEAKGSNPFSSSIF